MPPFAKSECPPEMDDNHLEIINSVVERLRRKIVPSIILRESPSDGRTPNLTRGYIQAHLRRIIMFVDGGHAEYLAGRPLMTEMASRAIYENIANFCDFSEKLKPLCDNLNHEAMESLVRSAAFTTRLPHLMDESGSKAPNILSQIDKMKKRYAEFREAYDHLSEIVHPNGLGSIVYFARLSETELTFFDRAAVPERSIQSLISATFLLLFVDYEMTEIETRLKAFSAGITSPHPPS